MTVANDEFLIDPAAVFALEATELESQPDEPFTVIYVGSITVLAPGTPAEVAAFLDSPGAQVRGLCLACDRDDVPVVDGRLAVHAGAGPTVCPGSGAVGSRHEQGS